jgi:hypothetical protein
MRGEAMKKKLLIINLFLLCLAAGFSVRGQFTPEEIAQRAQSEEFLKTAEITKYERIGEGVTEPWKLYLKQGGIEKKAAWKNIDRNLGGGVMDSWKYEIAAYCMDKLIGLNMVPPAVEREFRGNKGALSLWADSKYSLLKIMEQRIKIPESAQKYFDDMKYIYRLWSCLIANDDPTQQNILYTEDWRIILIDHSRAFRSNKKYTERLVFGINGIKKTQADGKPFLIRRIPRVLLDKIKALDFASIKQAVGPYLTDKEIEAIIARKKLILDEIAEMIKQYGEDKVLYYTDGSWKISGISSLSLRSLFEQKLWLALIVDMDDELLEKAASQKTICADRSAGQDYSLDILSSLA